MPLSNRLQPDGIAPNSAHVMWTRPIQDGGIVGGSNVGVTGAAYYTGLSYEYRFVAPIIIQGRMYYPLPLSNSAAGSLGNTVGGGYVCVDLQTGELIWQQNYTVYPTFGQLLWYDSPNQHGVIPYLWAVSGSTWIAYEPSTGKWLFNITNVPAGTNVYGPDGEILRYVLGSNGQSLACWNNTASIEFSQSATGAGIYYWRPVGKIINGSTSYSWNISIPQLPTGSVISKAIVGDLILGNTPTSPPGQRWGTTDTYTFWAISLKPETLGQLLWQKTYSAPENNITRLLYAVDAETRTFLMADKETRQWLAYDLDSGDLLWGPVGDARDLNYYGTVGMGNTGQAGFPAYGNLYTSGYGGELFCYDLRTGDLEWKYNNTNSGVETPWGLYPLFIGAIADGKVYTYSTEHSPNEPLYKGSLVRCINAYTGEEIWTIPSWAGVGTFGSEGFPVADGYIAYLNHYDAQIYTIGKGPSYTTINASPKVIPQNSGVLIEGTVTDICFGAKQLVDSGKFNIVPAMSDESQSDWMSYLYMQKPMPTDATGVQLRLTAISQNGQSTELGIVTTDLSGSFSYLWNDIPAEGTYTIVAAFEGSQSYWPSTAQTAVGIIAQAEPTPTNTQTENSLSTESLLIIGSAIAIIIVLLIVAVILRKR
jgi:outer membrane protein assembly factor BamB